MRPFAFLILLAGSATGFAAELPTPGDLDARVRYVTYKKDEVVVIRVRRGTVTRIVLAADEKIVESATGFRADCKSLQDQAQTLEWCITAEPGKNQIWVKPIDEATYNNLEVQTDKRDYSFEFMVLPDSETGRSSGNRHALLSEPMYRVVFKYLIDLPPATAFLADDDAEFSDAAFVPDDSEASTPTTPDIRNWSYSMTTINGGEIIAPAMVFDDGRFTYFQFPHNRDVPSIFSISPTEEESRLNFHMEGDFAVVERLAGRFVLRLGNAVVGIWNDAYDPDGVAPENGVTVDGLTRVIR